MPETFIWTPQKAYSLERTPNVAVVNLGDGYEQRQTKGINPLMDKYALTFKGVDDKCGRVNVARMAEAFLKARMAVESFYWTPSMTGARALFVCRSWNMVKNGPLYELTATFEQVPR